MWKNPLKATQNILLPGFLKGGELSRLQKDNNQTSQRRIIMNSNMEVCAEGLKIRWLACSCFEIELPGGVKIITDPFITGSANKNFSREEIEGADYILVTHTHYDHVMDLGYLAEKFNAKILVGMLSAYDLAAYFDLNPKHIHTVTDGQIFSFANCTIQTFFGKHVDLPYSLSRLGKELAEKNGLAGMERVNNNGSLEFVSYLITLKNNLRILFWGGKIVDEQYKRLQNCRPNLALMQIPGHSQTALAQFINYLGPQIVIPHHHDSLAKNGTAAVDQYLDDLAKEMAINAPLSMLLKPNMGQWYEVKLTVKAV